MWATKRSLHRFYYQHSLNLIPSLAIGQSSPFNLRSLGSIIGDNARRWFRCGQMRLVNSKGKERKTETHVILSLRLLVDVSRMSSRCRARGSAVRCIGDIPIRDVTQGTGCCVHSGKNHRKYQWPHVICAGNIQRNITDCSRKKIDGN